MTGYLGTGTADIVFPAAPKVQLYVGWPYVLVAAGVEQARDWRPDWLGRSRLPELIFPANRAWLLSTLWDDTWTCVGGPRALITDLVSDQRLSGRQVHLGEDATPPGHVAR